MINIIDAMCGTGKTSAAINYINESDPEKSFIFITPYLEEANRIIQSCPRKSFHAPKPYGTKLKDIKRLIKQGRNIVSTHALFASFDEEVIRLLRATGYTLIIDEVTEVIEQMDITTEDVKMLLNENTRVDDNQVVVWMNDDYVGVFSKFRQAASFNNVYRYGDKDIFIWTFPADVFRSFDDIFILTYMFDAQLQRCYFDLYDLKYQYLYVDGDSLDTYRFIEMPVKHDLSKYASLIKIADHVKLNRIGDDVHALSKSWYASNANGELIDVLKNNIYNFFRHISETPSGSNLWTTFKDYRTALSGNGYSRGFLSCNARATNKFRDRTAVAYCINRYMNPVLKNFFLTRNIRVDEDRYALSELIQWLFRSAIRDGKPVEVYIPSKRMRNLLEEWLEEIKC